MRVSDFHARHERAATQLRPGSGEPRRTTRIRVEIRGAEPTDDDDESGLLSTDSEVSSSGARGWNVNDRWITLQSLQIEFWKFAHRRFLRSNRLWNSDSPVLLGPAVHASPHGHEEIGLTVIVVSVRFHGRRHSVELCAYFLKFFLWIFRWSLRS